MPNRAPHAVPSRLHHIPGPSPWATRIALVALGLLAATAACTTTVETVPAPAEAAPATPDAAEEDAGAEASAPEDVCGPVAKSRCKPANAGSVIRGVVKFDPSKVKAGTKARLRVFLHHQVLARADEAKQGGHPHAWKDYALDMEKGEARFSLDLCEFNVAMYSEENCGFNIVTMIDDDGGNDPDELGITALIPRTGKLTKMVPVEVSCHKPSQCLEITADCADGEACTTFEGLTKCATCAADSCPSDDKLCKM